MFTENFITDAFQEKGKKELRLKILASFSIKYDALQCNLIKEFAYKFHVFFQKIKSKLFRFSHYRLLESSRLWKIYEMTCKKA